MNLLDELDIDPADFRWEKLALCRKAETVDYFDKYEQSSEHAKQIDQGCMVCPVISQCFMQGSTNNEWGVWGGVYWDGTGKPDADRNKHKTDEDWSTIRERVADGQR